jgi:HSP20 family protein
MEANMNMLSMLPSFGRARAPARFESDPFLSLHREINRAFDDAFRSFGLAPAFGGTALPSVDVHETAKGLEVTAELPGVEEKDVDVTIANGALTIRGEKKHESDRDDAGYRLTERSYGSFTRSLPLPFDVDEDAVTASFEKGVLRIALPKSAQADSQVRRIAIGKGK